MRQFIWLGKTEYEWTSRRGDATRRHLLPLRTESPSGVRTGIFTNVAVCGTTSAMPMFNSKWNVTYPCEICNRLVIMSELAE